MTELAYDERTTAFTTTNTTKFSTATAAIISGLDVTVVGTGAAVEVEFYCPALANSASLLMSSWFVVTINGATTSTVEHYRNWPASTGGTGGSMRRRMVIPNGDSYKFEVGLSATGASTTTAKGSDTVGSVTTGAMSLRIVG